MLRISHRLPLAGILFSTFILRSGTAVTSLALPWLINAQITSPFWASLAISICFIMSVFGALLGGLLIDRIGSVLTVRIVCIFGSVSTALIPFLFQFNTLTQFLLILLLACATLFDAVVSSTQDSRIPEIANLAELPLRSVVAAKSVISYIAMLSTPLVAGIAANVWGTEQTLLHSSLALLLGGFTLSLAMSHKIHENGLNSPKAYSAESALTSLRSLWQNNFLLSLILVSAGAVSIVSVTSGVIVPKLIAVIHGNIQNFGGFIAALSAGSILGSIIYGIIGHKLRVYTIGIFSFLIISISMLIISFNPLIPVLIMCGIMLGTATSPITSIMSVILFKYIDFKLRGRTFGLVTAIITSTTAVTMILVGYGIDKLGIQTIIILLAAISGVFVFFIPYLLKQTASDTRK